MKLYYLTAVAASLCASHAVAMNVFKPITSPSPMEVDSRTTPSPHLTRSVKRKLEKGEETETAKKLKTELVVAQQALAMANGLNENLQATIIQTLAINDDQSKTLEECRKNIVDSIQHKNAIARELDKTKEELGQTQELVANQALEIEHLEYAVEAAQNDMHAVAQRAETMLLETSLAFADTVATKDARIEELEQENEQLRSQLRCAELKKRAKDSLDHMYG